MNVESIALAGLVATSLAQAGLITWLARTRPAGSYVDAEAAATVEELLGRLESVSDGLLKELDVRVREARLLADRLSRLAEPMTSPEPWVAPEPSRLAEPSVEDGGLAELRTRVARRAYECEGGITPEAARGGRAERLRQVRSLARAGMGPAEIARTTKAGRGEVELLLTLERRRAGDAAFS